MPAFRMPAFWGWILGWFLIIAPFGTALQAVESGSTRESRTSDPSLTSLRTMTSEMLKLQATSEEGPPQDQATIALCDLYVRLRTDARYQSSEMLQQDASKVRRRLLSVAKRKRAALKRSKVVPPKNLSRDIEIALAAQVDEANTIPDRASSPGDLSESTTRPAIRGGAFAAGGAFDNGWQLVELIQRVVAPDFWQERGGSGHDSILCASPSACCQCDDRRPRADS